ncbi:MAG TPA: hypothetical protein VEO54_13175 [Thermoanaerobaculia bacterium]|nr:hypothetical protein [Thermoanaerobaculia bacterium]
MARVAAAVAVAAALFLLHRAHPLGWDELEFFRATKWVSEGRVPFRDFWEHHTPLQWLVFAPVARFIDSPGAIAVVAMRWAQAVMWVGILALVLRLAKERAKWWALVLLLAAPLFVRSAVEYRIDVLGNLCFLGALVCAFRQRWIAFGALMSLAVLANMRVAPLVVFTAALFLFWNERWRWNPGALRMLVGVAAVALPFIAWLRLAGAWEPFLAGVVRYNVASSDLLEVDTLREMLLAPFLFPDPAAIVLWIAALAGAALSIRTPLAIIFLATVASIAAMEVQYEYHFQGAYLLMVPLAAIALERISGPPASRRLSVAASRRHGAGETPARQPARTPAVHYWLLLAVAASSILLHLPRTTEPMRYQDYVMREVDRRTKPGDRVFDGTGYALRREPAYRYWFLPTGIRLVAAAGGVRPYDIAADPPAAILWNLRMQRWFEIFPRTGAFATRNYVPLTRDLWVPGLTATLPPGRAFTWTAHAAGTYTLYASEPLARHPWLTQPLQYAAIQGPPATRYAIPLRQLPRARVRWSVDGLPVSGTTVQLRKGARVSVASEEARVIGVMLVPADVAVLCVAPGEEFQF